MTTTLDGVTARKKRPEPSAEARPPRSWCAGPREQGLSLTGPDGRPKQLTRTVLETALNEEITEHLGHEEPGPAGGETGNVRNGTRSKTVLTEATGQVQIDVAGDRAGTFELQIVKNRQRRLTGVEKLLAEAAESDAAQQGGNSGSGTVGDPDACRAPQRVPPTLRASVDQEPVSEAGDPVGEPARDRHHRRPAVR